MPIVTLQRRLMELGRVRMGHKGPKGEPVKRDTFRFTSASKALLAAAAERYGGSVAEWQGAPDEGYFELRSEASEIEVVFPPIFSDEDGTPTVPVTQWFELWSGGGCQRRCNGETELLSNKPCLCDAGERACKPTTRMSFMLPELPGLGVWRLESHGYNAAAELPGTVAVLARAAHEGEFIPATLRIERRTKKQNGQTLRYIVPVVELRDRTVAELAGGKVASLPTPPPKPALPAATPEPESEAFENDAQADFGTPPALPTDEPEGLSPEEFKARCTANFLSPQKVAAVGKRMFPGRTRDTLSDEERLQLWTELEREREGAVA
jgi:Recombination directionality factor-like